MVQPRIWTSPSLLQPAGKTAAIRWGAFADRVVAAKPARSKEALGRWAPVEFRGSYRARANVLRAHAVVLDVDDGSALAPIAAALAGLFFVAHTTFSATPAEPRWRAVVPLDRPVSAEEYDRAARWLLSAVEFEGAQPDYASRDVAHAWAVPAVPPSGHYLTHVADGAFASVDDALAAIPPPEPPAAPQRQARAATYEQRFARAARYLARMDGAISGSGGHTATFKAALVLVRGFALEPDDALALLANDFNPRCKPAWSLRELRHKVRQAQQRSKLPYGHLADVDRRRAG